MIIVLLAGGGVYTNHADLNINGHTYMAFNDAYDGGERGKPIRSDACATNTAELLSSLAYGALRSSRK